ncbi:hypothetical protein [Streptomyces europaeiscabiei]|nr:hypothetical protein [Streptomyces europaeiscabiei]MDX3611688.1 hypothetical protein [Streptomyces europaeiscabiei]MDX3834932.1 hypothetical protein [Streptomyces europaeiscabiei]
MFDATQPVEEVASGGGVEIGEAGAGGGEQRGERSHATATTAAWPRN